MKRERALQVVLVLVGLFYSFWGYLLFDDLWYSRWLSGHSDVMPMFLSCIPAALTERSKASRKEFPRAPLLSSVSNKGC